MREDLGIPSPDLQQQFDATKKRIQERRDRFYGKTSAVTPVDESKLTPQGKAYREKLKNVGTTPKALRLDSILARINSRKPIVRPQVLPYEEARIVVDAIYENELAVRNRYPIWDDETDLLLEKVTRYFIGDPGDADRMMPNPFQGKPGEPATVPVDWIPLTKSIFLYGDVGVGKTFLFDVMCTLAKVVPIEAMQFQVISAKEIILAVHNAKSMHPISQLRKGGLLIDDLGEEDRTEMVFGKHQDPMDHLLSYRYRAFIQTGLLTHFTSNKQPDELESIYGTRVFDRLLEMVEPLLFPGTSKRPSDA